METELFTRYGKAHTGPCFTSPKGAKFFVRPKMCSRCGGKGGGEQWRYTGYTCYECGGRGNKGTESVMLYTAEKLAKLNATQAKAHAKREAKRAEKAAKVAAEEAVKAEAFKAANAELIAKTAPYMENEFIVSVMGKALRFNSISEKQLAAVLGAVERIEAQAKAKAASEYVGTPGKREEFTVTVERVASYQRASFSGWSGPETVWIVTMRTESGAAIVSKTPSFCAEKGEVLKIRATVKEHSVYNEEKQTLVQRIAIVEEIKKAA